MPQICPFLLRPGSSFRCHSNPHPRSTINGPLSRRSFRARAPAWQPSSQLPSGPCLPFRPKLRCLGRRGRSVASWRPRHPCLARRTEHLRRAAEPTVHSLKRDGAPPSVKIRRGCSSLLQLEVELLQFPIPSFPGFGKEQKCTKIRCRQKREWLRLSHRFQARFSMV